MSEIATRLLSEALALSPEERCQLAQQLFDSLEGDDPVLDDPEFQAELQRRLDAIANGTAELIPWEVARENLHSELQRRRAERQTEGGK